MQREGIKGRSLVYLRRAADLYPLTFAGSCVLGLSLYLFYYGALKANAYALFFSVLSLVVLTLLFLDGVFQALRALGIHLMWDSAPLVSRFPGSFQKVITGQISLHPFYRLHFILTGRLQAGRGAQMFVHSEGVSATGGEILVPVYFPVCGEFFADGRLFIRDIFGFTKARIAYQEGRTVVVRAPFFPMDLPVRLQSIFHTDGAKKKNTSEEEKYYMREYIPGDRLKDINWKASFKIQELITKISPVSPEETRLLHISFRNYAPAGTDTLESIMHLNYLKSWLISFIASVKKEHPDYRFRIATGSGALFVETDADLAGLSRDISALTYAPEGRHLDESEKNAHEIFIFTTRFDTGLPAYLGLHPHVNFHVFRTNHGKPGRVIRFFGEDMTCLPGPWVFRYGHRPEAPGVRASLVEENLNVKAF